MKLRRLFGKIAAATISLAMAFSLGENSGLLNSHITAKAAGDLLIDETTLYLKGDITSSMLRDYNAKQYVKRIRVHPSGCKLPSDCSHMFNNSNMNDWPNLKEIDLIGADVSQVQNMDSMFAWCDTATYIRLADVTTGTKMGKMFYNCSSIEKADLLRVQTTHVTDMNSMFAGCYALTSMNISNFDTKSVSYMNYMFMGCANLEELRFPAGFSTASAINMAYMFTDCEKLEELNLTNFNTSRVYSMESMFSGCTSLKTIYASDKWSTANVSYSDNMFSKCVNLKGGNGTSYSSSHVNGTYARIDRNGQPGYLTGEGGGSGSGSDSPAQPQTGEYNYGLGIVDLTKSTATISNKSQATLIANTIDGADYSGAIGIYGNPEWRNGAALDLDGNGTQDIFIVGVRSNTDNKTESVDIITLATNSIKGSVFITLTNGAKGWLESNGNIYYSSLKFVFGVPTAPSETVTPTVVIKPQETVEAPRSRVGEAVTEGGACYTIIAAEADRFEVRYDKPASSKVKSANIPDSIKLDGTQYKVTEIAPGAFKSHKKLKKITVGKNIVKIGSKAFFKCNNLKSVKIKTTALTKKNVGKAAFKGIHPKATIKVPKKKIAKYQSILKARGINGKEQKVTK